MEALAADGPRRGVVHAGSVPGRGPRLKGNSLGVVRSVSWSNEEPRVDEHEGIARAGWCGGWRALATWACQIQGRTPSRVLA